MSEPNAHRRTSHASPHEDRHCNGPPATSTGADTALGTFPRFFSHSSALPICLSVGGRTPLLVLSAAQTRSTHFFRCKKQAAWAGQGPDAVPASRSARCRPASRRHCPQEMQHSTTRGEESKGEKKEKKQGQKKAGRCDRSDCGQSNRLPFLQTWSPKPSPVAANFRGHSCRESKGAGGAVRSA